MANNAPDIWIPRNYVSSEEPLPVSLSTSHLVFVARAFDPDDDELEFHWTGPEDLQVSHQPVDNGVWTSSATLSSDLALEGQQVIVQVWDHYNRVDIIWELVQPETDQ